MTGYARTTDSLALAALRMEAAANEFARHLIGCRLDICPEALDLADDADLAAGVYGHEFQRQQQLAASRLAVGGAA